MKKIISLFVRNYDGDRLVRNEITPGTEWVVAGEGMPTLKIDGTCCMVRDGKLFKRYEVKEGNTPPTDFEPANEVDKVTGKQQGWRPVGDKNEDKWHREAFAALLALGVHTGGTYELIGPKVNGNPESWQCHELIPHDVIVLGLDTNTPRDFDGLKAYFSEHNIEGVVWHHPDGRMVKIKGKDFGIKRPKQSKSQ